MADLAQVKLVNRALFFLGQDPVPDLSEAALQASVAASKLMRAVDDARDAVLGRHGWACALEYATLSPAVIAGYVNWRYPTVFQLPANFIRMWEIGGELWDEVGVGPRWQMGSVEVGASAQPVLRASRDCGALDSVNIAYVRRCAWMAFDTNLFEAAAWELASRAALSIIADRGAAAEIGNRAAKRILEAVSADGTQEGGQPSLAPSIPASLRARAR